MSVDHLSAFSWKVDLGNLLTIVSVLIALWSMHLRNVTRYKDNARQLESNARRLENIEVKIETVWGWWIDHQRRTRDSDYLG